MLTNLGYDPGTIDGFYGSKSRRAVIDFRVAEGKAASHLISDELMTDLLAALTRDTTKLGYNLCNRANRTVWAAIGYLSDNSDWLSRGWWKVEPGECVKPIRKALQRAEYYVHVSTSEAHEELALTKSDMNLCIADVKFEILGKDNCELRGYTSVGFEKVTTDGSNVWTQTISLNRLSENQLKEQKRMTP